MDNYTELIDVLTKLKYFDDDNNFISIDDYYFQNMKDIEGLQLNYIMSKSGIFIYIHTPFQITTKQVLSLHIRKDKDDSYFYISIDGKVSYPICNFSFVDNVYKILEKANTGLYNIISIDLNLYIKKIRRIFKLSKI